RKRPYFSAEIYSGVLSSPLSAEDLVSFQALCARTFASTRRIWYRNRNRRYHHRPTLMGFFRTFLASLLAIFVSFLILFFFFVAMIAGLASQGASEAPPYVRDNTVLVIP